MLNRFQNGTIVEFKAGEDIKAVNDIAKIWAIVLPAMWW